MSQRQARCNARRPEVIIARVYSMLLLALAALDGAAAVGALAAWARAPGRARLALFPLAALAAVTLDVALAGLGSRIGPGELLRDLYAFPIILGSVAVPLTLFTLATLSRRLGLAWARIDWGHGAVCLFATGLLVYELRNLLALREIAPACWRDVVWYLRDVPAALACAGAPASLGGIGTYVAPVLVLTAWLALGVALARHCRWPGLLAGMLPGAALLLLPPALGPLPHFIGASLCFIAMAATAARYPDLAAGGLPAEPVPRGSP